MRRAPLRGAGRDAGEGAVRICSPHCGIDPETTSGGETYERELLRHLGALGHAVELLLARHKRYPDGVPNWTVHRLPVGRGLRWPAALLAQHGLDGKVVALFLGGLKERKNLFFLLDVWREVARAREDARLVVAGSGPLQVPLERYAAKLRLDGRVVFAGYVQESAKVEYYNLADLLLFPSAMEGFGLTVAEAMSCELPVVVSDRGSLPELVVDGEGGFLVDPSDHDAFVRKTLRLCADPMP